MAVHSFSTVTGVHAQVLFIANKSVSETALTSSEIKDIFLGKKKKWSNNTRIYFVVSGNDQLHEAFLQAYISKTPNQFNAYWKNMLFTGKGSPPKVRNTDKEVIEYVAEIPGAIGYIDSGSTPASVKTLSVQ